ncbi:type IV pilus twitching motility protein PilT [Caproiciproducens sp. MSJ-32]|uniref:type IV pilus twitching motility protein PilT n=1 Tax=Caproiciproducens sp. MSJ-32 TaxID=2841527 RepID=UPI001C0FDD21|nr:type IV pilus twitching motility protein PilT [Caproiciproducens sp. MSJ-32]MBU5454090.1 type IV pilus twitching motility protein PilT [Caproiciproducens sp. MSJ-32]
MYALKDLLSKTIEMGASDLHLTVGLVPTVRKNGSLEKVGDHKLTPGELREFAKEILEEKYAEYNEVGEIDTSYSISGIGRFRVNIFKQRNSDAIAIRVIALKIPTLDELKHPKVIKEIIKKQRGLVLVTGATGSGKSTTLAAIINEINNTREAHIITLEDPIEYLHKHNKSIINQREIGKDSKTYQSALRAILREDPDVILVGEMRDLETISIALTAAETGHLVFSTLHTIGAAKTIDRIIDVFPPHQQQQIRIQLSAVLQGVISQQLVPTQKNNGRVAALEIMVSTPGIQNLIREGKTYQIESAIQTGGKYGMKTMDMALAELYKKGEIDLDTALSYSVDKETLKRIIML